MGKKIEIPDKEELYSKYIKENLMKEELASYYGTSVSTISRWLSVYGMKKDPSLVQKNVEKSIGEKYGSRKELNSKSLRKRKETCLEKYGVDNVSKKADVVSKIRGSLEKHYKMPSKEDFYEYYCLQGHSLSECAEKFGIHLSTATKLSKKFGIKKNVDEVSDCRKKTCLRKYGTDSCLKNEEIHAKAAATVREKYGVDNVFASDEIKKKIKDTNLVKYGVEFPMKNEEFREKMKKKMNEKHGVEYAGQVHTTQKAVSVLSTEKTLREFIRSQYGGEKPTIVEISNDLGCSETAVGHKINAWGMQDLIGWRDFLPEKEIKAFLEGMNICFVEHDRSILSGKEIDFYIPSKKIGIEFNGSYWHSEAKKDLLYHQRKSLLAAEKGVFIFHIFEYEWECPSKKEKILEILRELLLDKDVHRIYARNTVVREVTKEEKKVFLDANHLQGNDRSSVCYGLYDGDKLVALMSFCKPRFSKTGDWEISRYCSLQNVRVLGGASKLFLHFLKTNTVSCLKIISFSVISKMRGDLYEKLGFVLDHISKPNYVWWKKKEEIKSRYSCQMKDEDKIMHEQGYKRIFDSGNKVWVYSVK